MTERNGGPAFPVYPESGVCSGTNGMTLRDYFAAQALAALLAGDDHRGAGAAPGHGTDLVTRYAYRIADAMLEERERD